MQLANTVTQTAHEPMPQQMAGSGVLQCPVVVRAWRGDQIQHPRPPLGKVLSHHEPQDPHPSTGRNEVYFAR